MFVLSHTLVAPRVGAWIETSARLVFVIVLMSHPVWVRGLKRGKNTALREVKSVAPRVGAWIETSSLAAVDALSHVAPRVGAWIETLNGKTNRLIRISRTPCGCVD